MQGDFYGGLSSRIRSHRWHGPPGRPCLLPAGEEVDIWLSPFHPHGPAQVPQAMCQVPLGLLDGVEVPESRWVVARWTGHLELKWLSMRPDA